MQEHTLKINYVHIKKQIQEQYFTILDLFHRCFAVGLVIHDCKHPGTLESVILENPYYNNLLPEIKGNLEQGKNILSAISDQFGVSVFMDVNTYLEEFLEKKFVTSKSNICHVTINSDFELVIVIKQIGKRIDLKRGPR